MVGYHGSTICAVRRNAQDVCIGGDGQITKGDTITKNNASKVGRMGDYPVIYGCAGTILDTTALVRRFKNQLFECDGNLNRIFCLLGGHLWLNVAFGF